MSETRLYELRTYVAHPGKFEALQARFRDHTCTLFRKHGMEIIGFWTPTGAGTEPDTLIYLLAFPDADTYRASWEAFRADPDWIAARDASERNGKLVARIESVLLEPTDYSPLR